MIWLKKDAWIFSSWNLWLHHLYYFSIQTILNNKTIVFAFNMLEFRVIMELMFDAILAKLFLEAG